MAERQITANKPTPFKASVPPKAQERELSKIAEYMVREISQTFRKEVLEAMSKPAVEAFSDTRPVNFATEYNKRVAKIQRDLAKRFGDARIQELISKLLKKVDSRNRSELYSKVEKAIGLSTKELTATEGLKAKIDAYIAETTAWVQKLRDDTLAEYTANTLRAMSLGQSLEEVMDNFTGMVEKRKNHAKFVARNQIANFNSLTTKARAQNLGITEARWITSRDERVRESHIDRGRDGGKVFKLDKGCYSDKDGKWLLPGVDYQCRCTYELIIPEA